MSIVEPILWALNDPGLRLGFTELHRHLDASVRIRTLWELSQKQGHIGLSTSFNSFKRKTQIKKPLKNLKEVLDRFVVLQKIFVRPEVLERIAFEATEDCHFEGIRKAEFRFSPSFISEIHQLTWGEILDAFEKGVHRALETYPDMKVGLICIASRDYGLQSVEETIDFYIKNKKRLIGLDLAGNEVAYPAKMFQKSFQKAKRCGANITIHAGEASGPESVWEAIEFLGASRIGHGIGSINDISLVKYLAKNEVCLEICPTSNWMTSVVSRLKLHPLRDFLRNKVPVTINTDDPTLFGNSLPGEIHLCKKILHLTNPQIRKCFENANKYSFIK